MAEHYREWDSSSYALHGHHSPVSMDAGASGPLYDTAQIMPQSNKQTWHYWHKDINYVLEGDTLLSLHTLVSSVCCWKCSYKYVEMGKIRGTICCSAIGCSKRKRIKSDQNNRSDSDGEPDEESTIKRQYPRTFHA